MFEKLQAIEDRYQHLEQSISDPSIISRQSEWRKLTKEHARISDIVAAYRQYKVVEQELREAKEMLREGNEEEMSRFLKEEVEENSAKKEELAQQLRVLLLPRDPNDEKSVIVEVRAGTGGEEAALFAGDLLRMYTRYAERQGWKTEILSTSSTDIGGFREVVFAIEGNGAYSRLKYESGVHRVQRVPATESGGRIHTSAATVAVLPEAEEVEVEINANDVRIDVFCSSGPGGQSVNTTQSAVRITHLPSGIVVSCQDEKSQHKNKDKAMRVLRARLFEKAQEEQAAETAQARKSQVGSGDRSERIRTYNYPQGRVSDHRIGMTLYKLEYFLDGDINEMIDALNTSAQAELLKKVDA
ncbi:MAG: peptide chain release factor 1 [Dethiobacter sp.]|jgi:peptide chain release factor 1|nr:peptide chain release factor 1 [Dethiobacter sp.]MBS3899293.1 peptide chain release factor 1 [Dethiobacter sp.]MBS3982749.1 peptide chain release factor 1 [Dethiobacter sp.]MCL4462717.1 peptide chain release factor 1 [Bacillota bacterium]MCL5994408.1 peptide chain release factor 1 [Bacillota bacterium]